jgi:hypothetical protein
MMIGVYAVLSLGAVDIAFSLTRFLIIQTTAVDDFRSITTIGKSLSPLLPQPSVSQHKLYEPFQTTGSYYMN